MSRIKVLPENLCNRIAAGEVIGRPASVVKELVENAIDAGARTIRIAVERAGIRRISVTDDGFGMAPDDVLLALEVHGTSKIAEEPDIENITTLGFRGEAIPSIASISRFTLTSRTAEAPEGSRLTVDGGKFLDCVAVGAPAGTTVDVRDLFFNTPARKKFLRSDATELHRIMEMVISLALPYCGIAFRLTVDGKIMLDAPAGLLEDRLRRFFGKGFSEQMLPVHFSDCGIEVMGFTAGPGFTRTSRYEQRTFVNGRAVESAALYRGVRDGYAALPEHGRYAPCILFVHLNPHEVDVNVHPAKREVRFKQEFTVTRVIKEAVNLALRAAPTPESSLPQDLSVNVSSLLDEAVQNYSVESQEELFSPKEPEEVLYRIPLARHGSLTDRAPVPETEEKVPAEVEMSPVASLTDPHTPDRGYTPNFQVEFPDTVLGVFDDTYLLCAGTKGLILIDQHAAHERILFEKILSDSRRRGESQMLLIPQCVELPLSHAALLLRSRDVFQQLGFDIEPMGGNSVMLNALPTALPDTELATLLQEILDELLEDPANRTGTAQLENIARAACKAAIKAHDKLDQAGAEELLRQLKRCRQGTLCPHGRPTMVTISRAEIIRRFRR